MPQIKYYGKSGENPKTKTILVDNGVWGTISAHVISLRLYNIDPMVWNDQLVIKVGMVEIKAHILQLVVYVPRQG